METGRDAALQEGRGPEYTWIAAPDALEQMIRSLNRADRIAIDVEGDSLYHYFEKVCLIQISTDRETYIIDPLSLRSLDGLDRILSDCSKEKVLHAAAYDVSSLRRDYRFLFCNVFDTHVCAELLGFERRGLDDLLHQLLGVKHSKRRQRDDWSRRPLDPAQLRYAAMDTHHLLALRDLLAEQLLANGRMAWAEEEFRHASESAPLERKLDPDGFLKIKGSRELSGSQLSVLRSLYLLRDRYAR
ncbi:MAG: ribonuclease D, partial [Acidobacteria bacterium]|nr:ribonuclease D [Acidobacteriota bacterium]